ncbi:MAG: hypothetical protein ACU836_06130 [Gammaproteobacteria bacterium]
MMHLSAMKRPLNVLFILILAGCAQLQPPYNGTQAAVQSYRYSPSNVTEILAFGAEIAKMNESSRAEKCKALASQTKKPGEHRTIQLKLMVGRLLSDSCGDIPALLEEIDRLEISRDAVDLQHLVALHKLALIRIYEQSQKLSSMEQKRPKVIKSSPDAKGTDKSEARILREKLEAIRSMEKQLDESSSGN